MTKSEMEEYKEYVVARLSHLSPFMQSYALGDFSEPLDIPEEEDEFTELLVGLTLMVDDVKEMIEEKEDTISRLKQTEEALLKSEQRFRSLVETISEWIWEVDQNGIYTYASPKIKDLLGHEPEEVIGKTPFDLMSPDEAERVGKIFQSIVESREPFAALENVGVHKDGRQVVLETSGVPIFDASGNLLGYRGIDRDVTERKQAEEALRHQWERFLVIISNFPEILYVVDPATYEVLLVNKALEEALGSDPTGKLCYQAFQGFDAPCAFCTNETILRERKPYTWEHHNPIINRDYLITDQIINWPDGRDVRFEIAIDITERKQTEERIGRQTALLEAVNKMLREAMTCETGAEVAWTCLAVAEELTDSQFGFVGEVNSAGRFDTIAMSDPGWDACRIPESNAVVMINDMEIRGYWGSAIKDGKSLIVNDPTSHPDRVGTPEDHPPLISFLGVPLKQGDMTIGMIALANKESGYDLADRQDMEALAVAFVEALMRKRAEEKLKQTVDELERANAELEQFNRLAVGREMRMIELKRQINELAQEMGREPPYDLSLLGGMS